MYRVPGLFRRSNGIFYLRVYIPKYLVARFGCREIVRSLGTTSPRSAEGTALALRAGALRFFVMVKQNPKLDDMALREMAKRFFDRLMDKAEGERLGKRLKQGEWEHVVALHTENIERLENELERNIFVSAEESVDEILKFEGITLDAKAPQRLQLAHFALRALIQVQETMADRTRGNHDAGIGEKFSVASAPGRQAAAALDESISLETLPSRFGQAPRDSYQDVCGSFLKENEPAWKAKTVQKNRANLAVCGEIIGNDTPVTAISRATVRQVKESLTALPVNWTRRYPDQPIASVVEKARGNRDTPISPGTINAYLGSLSSFFSWATKNGYMEANPASDLKVPDPVRAEDKRDPFSPAQLQTIYSAPVYTGMRSTHFWKDPGNITVRDERFWIPLLALYSGMRLGEIVDLKKEDLEEEDGIPVLRIRQAKTRAGIRSIPVHSVLSQCGFIAYAGELAEGSNLFGNATQKGFSKHFRRFLDSLDIKDPKLVFHSFRHTFMDAMRRAQIQDTIAKALIGHAEGSVSGRYGSGYEVNALNEAMESIDYPGLNLKHLFKR